MSGIVTMVAPVNIAVIKYWGKRNEELILPLNDSVSATLDTSVMCAKTSVCVSSDFTEDKIWLNGVKESFSNQRLQNCLREIKSRAAAEGSVEEVFLSWKIHVCSENNFPTAAGLASSAAGYACLVSALAKVYKIKSDVSSIARIGSGSACRSIYGGFVRWHSGVKPDGSDSIAKQIAEKSHWPEMSSLILVVGDTKKKVSSTIGMRISTKTSDLFTYRIQNCVPKRTEDMCKAIMERDFVKFAEITMKDSNQFHAICLDSYPPITYMTDVSHKITELIHNYNNLCGVVKVAYTFDAGPNACLYLLKDEVPKIIPVLQHVFPTSTASTFVTGLPYQQRLMDTDFLSKLSVEPVQEKDQIKYIIHTKVGDGPTEATDENHLLDESGWPINSELK